MERETHTETETEINMDSLIDNWIERQKDSLNNDCHVVETFNR